LLKTSNLKLLCVNKKAANNKKTLIYFKFKANIVLHGSIIRTWDIPKHNSVNFIQKSVGKSFCEILLQVKTNFTVKKTCYFLGRKTWTNSS